MSFCQTHPACGCLLECIMFPSLKERTAMTEAPAIRTFETGASRDTEEGKLDYEGFLSPQVLWRFAEYMNKNRRMRDGSLRDSDNWQKGIPKNVYMKSLWRHHMAAWTTHRAEPLDTDEMEESLCGILFNAMGYLHELIQDTE